VAISVSTIKCASICTPVQADAIWYLQETRHSISSNASILLPGGQLKHAWLLYFMFLTNQITREKEVKCQQQTGFLVKGKKQVENPRNPYNKRPDQTRPGNNEAESREDSYIVKTESRWHTLR
jgi:hypothetical protein